MQQLPKIFTPQKLDTGSSLSSTQKLDSTTHVEVTILKQQQIHVVSSLETIFFPQKFPQAYPQNYSLQSYILPSTEYSQNAFTVSSRKEKQPQKCFGTTMLPIFTESNRKFRAFSGFQLEYAQKCLLANIRHIQVIPQHTTEQTVHTEKAVKTCEDRQIYTEVYRQVLFCTLLISKQNLVRYHRLSVKTNQLLLYLLLWLKARQWYRPLKRSSYTTTEHRLRRFPSHGLIAPSFSPPFFHYKRYSYRRSLLRYRDSGRKLPRHNRKRELP